MLKLSNQGRLLLALDAPASVQVLDATLAAERRACALGAAEYRAAGAAWCAVEQPGQLGRGVAKRVAEKI